MKKIMKSLVAVLLMLSLGGCTEPQPEPQGPPTNQRMTAIFFDLPWAHAIEEGMRAAIADQSHIQLTTHYHEMNDIVRESELITENMKNTDALLIAVQDVDGSVAAIKAAHDAGVPVICLGSCLNDEDFKEYVTGFYGSDSKLLGYRTGAFLSQWLAENFPDGPVKLGVLHCNKRAECLARSTAFRAALRDNGTVWDEVANREGYIAEEATEVARGILEEFPETRVLWAANEGGTEGAVQAVRELGLEGQVFVFGTDLNATIAEMLLADDNVLQAVTGQEPGEIGRRAILGAAAILRGDLDRPFRTIGTPFYSRATPESIPKFVEPQEVDSDPKPKPPVTKD